MDILYNEKNNPKITKLLLNYLEKNFWKINKKQNKKCL